MKPPDPEESSGLDVYDKVVAAFIDHKVEFILVGAYAVIYYGYARSTDDLDLFIRPTEENARKAVAALKDLSLGEVDISPEVFTKGKGISIGERPMQVDVLSQIDGVTFDGAWRRRKTDAFGPAKVYFISRQDLIANKKAAGRPKDLLDVHELEAGGEAGEGTK